MLHESQSAHNGNGHFLHCESDYEPRPVIDIIAKQVVAKDWTQNLAPCTCSMSYIDHTGISYSVTFRGNSNEEVLEMMRPWIAGIRKAKASAGPVEEPVVERDVRQCKLHNVEMAKRLSKKSGKPYYAHAMPGDAGSLCFGRSK